MAATVELKVNLDYQQAWTNLRNLDTYATAMAKDPYVIRIEIKGADEITKVGKDALQLAKLQAQIAKSQAQQEKAKAQYQTQIAKAQQEYQKTARAANDQAIAEANAAKAQALHADTATNVATAQAKLATAENRVAVEQEKTAQTANRLATEQERTARATQSAGSAAESASNGFSVLGNAISTALGHLASRAVMWAVQKIRQGIREALDEMKNVDTELTNISKVSGKTGAELAAIGDTAYETASRYGVAASEYLSAVYDMQKAGMGDQAEAMGELAVKTMLVGDTTQDVASKFLLASNAAWKLNGDMGTLTQIVDEADYINNNYATTLDKLAAGMPIVASVAAQAGMSAEETMAALGTITTVTQESGTKAATALRALILNISKSVGEYVTEEGEAFEVTEESVKNLEGLLWKYAAAEMQAAKDAGKLIDPMTAIQALFKGMSEGDVNDVELFNLLSAMGGKLRTNQLTALVQNYGLFEEMLRKIGDAAGTADAEIEIMLGSWERKTQRLKNTWTELISDIIDTDTIKNGVDFLTYIVDGIDDVVNRLSNPFYDSENTQKEYDSLKKEYDALLAKGDNLTSIEKARLEILEKQLAVLQLQQKAEEEEAAKKLQRELTGNHRDEHTQTLYSRASNGIQFEGDIAAYQQSLRDLNAQYSEYYNNLTRVRDAGVLLTDAQKEFMSMYEDNSVAAMADIVDVRPTLDGYLALIDAQGNVVAYERDITTELDAQREALENQGKAAETSAEEWDAFKEGFSQPFEQAYADITGFFSEIFTNLNDYNASLAGLTTAQGEVTEEAGNTTEAASGIAPQIDTAISSANALASAFQSAAKAASRITVPTLDTQATGTKNAPGGPTLVNELGPELISDNGRAYIANGGRPGIVNLSRGAIVLNAEDTKKALNGNKPARSINAAVRGAGSTSGLGQSAAGAVIVDGRNIANTASSSVIQITTPTQPAYGGGKTTGSTSKARSSSSGGGGGGGGGGGSSAPKGKSLEDYAKELTDLLSNLDKQAKLAANENDYQKEVELWEQAQEAIKTMVDRYRKAGYADTSNEILDLLNKNYDYAAKQVNLYEDVWDDLIDALETDTEKQDLANKLAEKQLALQEAQEALANAQGQRTVRIYNAETGQWEWVADQSKVTSAQKTLTKAQEAYDDELRSQAVDELKAMKDTVSDLNDVVLGPALSAVALMAESSDEFQNFARALNAVYGVGTYLSSTEGSSKVLETRDSHDTVYSFGDVVLTEEQANTTTLAELAKMLKVLDTTN